MIHRRCTFLAVACSAVLSAASATAAEITDVVSAFDVENDNPFDIHIEPVFRQTIETGTISRERGCETCAEPVTDFRRELDYRRVRNEVGFGVQIGLWRDLELNVNLPIVVSDRRTLSYASDVGPENSSVDPALDQIDDDLNPAIRDYYDGPTGSRDSPTFGTFRYFDVPDDGPKRSGIGDMTIGLAWAPFSDRRRPHIATLKLAIDYLAPTGKPAQGDNTGVGRGVHELRLSLAASRVLQQYFEPYFRFGFAQPFAAGNGLFADQVPQSDSRAPGGRMEFLTGTEIILFSEAESGQHYSFDIGFEFGYVLSGRDYSPLSDALSQSSCNGLSAGDAAGGTDGNAYAPAEGVSPDDAACAWVVQQPGNVVDDSIPNRNAWTYAHDGITDVEGHARVGGRTGVNLQFSPYIELRLGVGVHWISPHFLTSANAGRDADGDEVVDLNPEPTTGRVERNPFYNLSMDPVGRRFRLESALEVSWSVAAAFQF